MRLRRQPTLLLAVLIALTLAACGSRTTVAPAPTARSAAPTYTPLPTFTAAPTRLLPTPVATQTVAVTGSPLTLALSVTDWDRATIAEAGISLDVPKSWKRLGTAWEWSVSIDGGPHIGANWADAGQGREPTAMLPNLALSLSAEDLTLPWGNGQIITVQLANTAAKGASAAGFESHAIIRVGSKTDYDFYASAPTQDELAALRPILQHVLDSVALLGG